MKTFTCVFATLTIGLIICLFYAYKIQGFIAEHIRLVELSIGG